MSAYKTTSSTPPDIVHKTSAVKSVFRLKELRSIAATDVTAEPRKRLVLIDGKVYDVSDFVDSHPGGTVILTHCNGEDATEVFSAFHPPEAHETLADFYVGDLHPDDRRQLSKDAFASDIEQLRQKLAKQGMFDSSKTYYLIKVLTNLAILGVSAYLLFSGQAQRSVPGLAASAFLLGLFWQQSGWLSHDFLHHQVFKNRSLNNLVGYAMGNIAQGFSVSWWKQKHNSHHAAPNIDGFDPDIDTMPILGWSIHALEYLKTAAGLKGRLGSLMVRYQKYTYFPLLAGARLLWCRSSATFALFHPSVRGWTKLVEASTLLLHWTLYIGAMTLSLTPLRAIAFFLISQASSGLMLALVFSLNHSGMPIYSAKESAELEFYRKQVLTGRDVLPTAFANWFTGGLNYQIEHHVFPMLPRHNFHKVKAEVERLCHKHGVRYHSTSFLQGTSEILHQLDEVAQHARGMLLKTE